MILVLVDDIDKQSTCFLIAVLINSDILIPRPYVTLLPSDYVNTRNGASRGASNVGEVYIYFPFAPSFKSV